MKKTPIFLLMASHVYVDLCQSILPIVLPLFKQMLALSYAQVGLVAAMLTITSSVLQPVLGLLSDRYPTGWLLPAGILWTGLLMGSIGFASSYPVLMLLAGLAGLGTAAFHPKGMMVTARASARWKGIGTSIFSLGGNLGFALGPPVGAFLVLGWGLHATAQIIWPGLVFFVLLLSFWHHFSLPSSELAEVTERGGASAIPYFDLALLCMIVSLRSWIYTATITFLPLHLQAEGMGLSRASHLLFLFLAAGAMAGLAGGFLSDIWGRKQIMVVTTLLFAPFFLLFLHGNGVVSVTSLGLAGAMLLAPFAVSIVVAQEYLPKNVGLASGLMMGLSFGIGGLGVGVSGAIADAVGLSAAMHVMGAIAVVAGLFTLLIRESHPESSGGLLSFQPGGATGGSSS